MALALVSPEAPLELAIAVGWSLALLVTELVSRLVMELRQAVAVGSPVASLSAVALYQ